MFNQVQEEYRERIDDLANLTAEQRCLDHTDLRPVYDPNSQEKRYTGSSPVGFDPENFTGPFLTILGLLVYIFPQVFFWGYFRARKSQSAGMKLQFSLLLLAVAAGMAVGIFAATMRMWLPKILILHP